MPFDARHDQSAPESNRPCWSFAPSDVLASLDASPRGLSDAEAARRLAIHGANTLKPEGAPALMVLLRQFRSPLVLILIAAVAVSAFVGDGIDAAIVSLIVAASCGLSFTQEWGASRAMEGLRGQLRHKVCVIRDGREITITAETIVPGDIVKVSAGALIPADGIVLDGCDCTVSEAALTGEPFPVAKTPAPSAANASLGDRGNMLFAGTSVRSGTATAVMVATRTGTEFAKIAATLERQAPETGFARGIRRFGCLMTQIMVTMTVSALAANFTEAGEITVFVTDSEVAYLKNMMRSQGYLDTKQMAGAFQMLRSTDSIWSHMVTDYWLGQRSAMFDLLAWNADATRMPYRMHSEYLERLFLDNQFANGHFTVLGKPVAAENIQVPIFAVGTESDHVAPWRSAYKIHLMVSGDVTFVLTNGGHNAGIVSEPGHPGRHYCLTEHRPGEPYLAPDDWHAAAVCHEGSWWLAWNDWLASNSDGLSVVAPASPGNDADPPREDAPGLYVHQK